MKIKEKLESEMATLDDHPNIDNLDIGDNVDESSESEIDRLDLYSPGLDSPTERGVAKTKKDEDLILKIIKQTRTLGSNTLELCDKKMLQIPRELLEMNNLEVKCSGLHKHACRVTPFNYIHYVTLLAG